MLRNSLYNAVSSDPKPSTHKDSLRLLALTCVAYPDSSSTHLTKIIGHNIKFLKDSDFAVHDACLNAIGSLSNLYLKPPTSSDNGNNKSVVGLFVAMGEQNKVVQSGAAMCMVKMVEYATKPPVSTFQKLCPKICRLLNNPNFLYKASLLPVVANLSQVLCWFHCFAMSNVFNCCNFELKCVILSIEFDSIRIWLLIPRFWFQVNVFFFFFFFFFFFSDFSYFLLIPN